MYFYMHMQELCQALRSASLCNGAGYEPDCKMAEATLHQERAIKAIALSPAFTAPAEFNLDNHSPASALSELDGGLEFDGLGLGPDLQYLLESHLAESPMHSDGHLLDEMDKVRPPHSPAASLACHVLLASETRCELTAGSTAYPWPQARTPARPDADTGRVGDLQLHAAWQRRLEGYPTTTVVVSLAGACRFCPHPTCLTSTCPPARSLHPPRIGPSSTSPHLAW